MPENSGEDKQSSWESYYGQPKPSDSEIKEAPLPGAENTESKTALSAASIHASAQPDRPQHLAELLRQTKASAKTILDHTPFKGLVSRNLSAKEQKLAEELASRPEEPVRPFQWIENYRKASPCGEVWSGYDELDRVKICEKCSLHAYDFTKLERPEAEALIFKTESRKDYVLYKRQDGKFLTNDCPVGRMRKKTIMVLFGIPFAAAFLFFILTPGAKEKDTASPAGDLNSPPIQTTKAPASSTPATSASRWVTNSLQIEQDIAEPPDAPDYSKAQTSDPAVIFEGQPVN